MKVDLSFKIQRLDGTEFIDLESDGVDEKGKPKFTKSKPLNLRKAIADALTTQFQSEQNLEPLKKAERGWLAMKIWKHSEPVIDLSVEEVALCKELIGKRYNPLITALAWEILDPESKK